MHVLFLGEADDRISVSSHHARALASAYDVQVTFEAPKPSADKADQRFDVAHLVTFEQTDNALLRHLVALRMAGIPIVRYWTGRDLVWAKHHAPSREFAHALVSLGSIQLCRSPEITRELEQMGVTATTLPIISAHISNWAPPQAMPTIFTVLCYLPSSRRLYHGASMIGALAARLPKVRFLVLGGSEGPPPSEANVELLPSCTDPVRAIQRSTVVLEARVDGALSRLALEALSHGRHLISTCEVPFGLHARTLDEFVQAIRTLRTDAPYNLDGRSFVGAHHEHHAATKALRTQLEDAIEPGRLNLVLEGGVRSAAAAIQNLHLLSQREFELPTPDELPPDAYPLRCLLQDQLQAQSAAVESA